MKIFKIFLLSLFIISISTKVEAQKKNVLLIIVDDLNTDEAAFGNDAVITPNIDALSIQGIQFTNTQCSWPVCGPSRASFMTGTYPETNGVMNLSTELRTPSPNIVTIPQYLKEIGYTTEAVGKVYDPRCIDENYDYPTSWTSPYSIKYTYPAKYGPFVKGQYRVPFPNDYIKGPSTEKGPEGVLDDGYIDGQIAQDAINRINNFKNSNKPFFLSVGFKKPHTPFISPKKYWDLYDINNIKLAPYQTLPKGTSDLALNNNNGEIKGYDDIRLLTSDQTNKGDFTSTITINGETFSKVLQEDKQKQLILGYYSAVSYIDAQIGKVIKALEDNGLKNNTLIILTSDHGFTLGDSGMWAKHNILNNTSNVPFIIVDPSSNTPAVETRAVQLIDIFPTICDWLNIPTLEQFQGNSMLANEANTTFPTNLAMTRFKKSGKIGYSFKRDNYRYTLWTKQSAKTDKYSTMIPEEEELYKYNSNTAQQTETENLINNESEQDKLKEIKDEVKIWWDAYNNNHTNESKIPDLAIDDFSLKTKFKLYPNPVTDTINIYGDFSKNSKIIVYALNGKIIVDKTIENIKNSYKLDVSILKTGNYILSVEGVNYKFIKL